MLVSLVEKRSPFNPETVVAEFASILARYGVRTVIGDRYGAEWPVARFRVHGITYRVSDHTKSELFASLLPLIMGDRVELLDHPRLVGQLVALERRVNRGGKDSIDHPPRGFDDVINAAAGALVAAAGEAKTGFALARIERFL